MNVSRSLLTTALASIAGIVAKNPTTPILACVLLSSDGDALRLRGTSQAMDLTTRVAASGSLDPVAVDVATLLNSIKSAPAGDVVAVTYDTARGKLRVGVGGASYALNALAGEEFPVAGTDARGEPLTFSGENLAAALGIVDASIAPDDNRYGLCGVHLHMDGERVRFVSTDGNRLAYAGCVVSGTLPRLGKMLIPRLGVIAIAKLAAAGEAVDLSFAERSVEAKAGDTTLTIRLMEADFPDYTQVLPESHKRLVILDRAELIAGVRAVLSMASDSTRTVRMAFSDDGLTMTARKLDAGDASITVQCEIKGEKITMGVNGQYLLDALVRTSGERVTLKIGDALSPVLIPGGDGALTVLMPVRLD